MNDLLGASKDAVFSPSGLYRYRLSRIWEPTKPPLVWIMLNPSTADAEIDDPTIRRCMSFSRREGAGSMEVLNLFALRSTDPAALLSAADPIGPDNDHWIAEVTRGQDRVVCAWGAYGYLLDRGREVVRRLRDREIPMQTFGLTVHRQPKHPLYISGDLPLVEF